MVSVSEKCVIGVGVSSDKSTRSRLRTVDEKVRAHWNDFVGRALNLEVVATILAKGRRHFVTAAMLRDRCGEENPGDNEP